MLIHTPANANRAVHKTLELLFAASMRYPIKVKSPMIANICKPTPLK